MAGRIRSIKPDLLDEERFAQLSDAGVRLFVGCMSLVDDAGVCPAGPTYLGGRIFYARPRSAISIGKLLAELELARLVDLFAVDRTQYLAIVGWAEKGAPTYQRIDKPQASRFPLPSPIRSWNGFDAGSDPIRKDPKGEGVPARAILPSTEPSTTPPPAAPIVQRDVKPEPAREGIATTNSPPRVDEIASPPAEVVHRPTTNRVAESAPARREVVQPTPTPPRAFDPDEPGARGHLAELTYRRVSDARLSLARELKLPEQLPFPPITPAARAGSYRDLLDRVREEAGGAVAACDRVVENLIAQAREERSIEWVAEKAFTAGGWRHARGWIPKAKRAAVASASPGSKRGRAPDPTRTAEELAELSAMARGVAQLPTAELVRRFGDGQRAPPRSASEASDTDQQEQSEPEPTRKTT